MEIVASGTNVGHPASVLGYWTNHINYQKMLHKSGREEYTWTIIISVWELLSELCNTELSAVPNQ